MSKALQDIAKDMKDIDFCMLVSRAADGSIGGRPMSNNSEVDYDGDSYFFTCNDTRMVEDVQRDPSVGLTYAGKAGLKGIVGAPGMFIHVEGETEVIMDKAQFAKHWHKSLDRWFKQGVDTPGLTMLKVHAKRIHYWDGEDEGEVKLPALPA